MNSYIRGRWLEFILGIIVLFGAISFVVFALTEVSDQSNLLRRSYTMLFSNTGGLREQDKVRIGGVDVGEVAVISIDQERLLPKVTIVVLSGLDIPIDSEARILNSGLLGGKYISITPGSSQEYLKSRDAIDRTVDAQSLEDFISRLLFIVQKKASDDAGDPE